MRPPEEDDDGTAADPALSLGRVLRYRSGLSGWQDVRIASGVTPAVTTWDGFSERVVAGPGVWMRTRGGGWTWACLEHGQWSERQ